MQGCKGGRGFEVSVWDVGRIWDVGRKDGRGNKRWRRTAKRGRRTEAKRGRRQLHEKRDD